MIISDKKLYNFEPKENIFIPIILYVAPLESTLQYGRLDTLNSKIHPQMIILWYDKHVE